MCVIIWRSRGVSSKHSHQRRPASHSDGGLVGDLVFFLPCSDGFVSVSVSMKSTSVPNCGCEIKISSILFDIITVKIQSIRRASWDWEGGRRWSHDDRLIESATRTN
jgi:hypothetical protein